MNREVVRLYVNGDDIGDVFSITGPDHELQIECRPRLDLLIYLTQLRREKTEVKFFADFGEYSCAFTGYIICSTLSLDAPARILFAARISSAVEAEIAA